MDTLNNEQIEPKDDTKSVDTKGNNNEQIINSSTDRRTQDSAGSEPKRTLQIQQRRIIAEDREWNISQVPKLTELCIKCIVKSFDKFPILDGLPLKYRSKVLKSIRLDLPFDMTCQLIPDEEYWQRSASARWNICNIEHHGGSWKQLFFENHVQQLIEDFVPGKNDFDELLKAITLFRDYVIRLDLSQLNPTWVEYLSPTDPKPDHIDLDILLKPLHKLESLSLHYTVKNCGMDFTWSKFGMTTSDAKNISNFIQNHRTLTSLKITQSDVDDAKMKLIATALTKNTVLQTIDLSHNKISDYGAKEISKALLTETSGLRVVILNDNQVELEGAIALAKAMSSNRKIHALKLRMNPIGTEGGQHLFNSLKENTNIKELDLSGSGLSSKALSAFAEALAVNNSLDKADLSNNSFDEQDGRHIVEALRENKNLTFLDLRLSGIDATQLTSIQYLLDSRKEGTSGLLNEIKRNSNSVVLKVQ